MLVMKITLITRPRRFGKTINLSMLEHFFNKKINGMPTKGLFNGLQIAKYPNIMDDQGKTSAIYISLKAIRGKNFDEAYGMIKEKISKLYTKHRYLIQSDKIYDDQKRRMQQYIDEEAGLAHYKTSLKYLSNLLYQFSGKKVYILLDEYDSPLNEAYINGYYSDMRRFMASLFDDAFKDNSFLNKAMITGIIKIAKSSLFSELNNVSVYTCLDSPLYSNYFGFTEEETNDYLDRSRTCPLKAHELKEMYNGYTLLMELLYIIHISIVNFASEYINTN